MSKLAAVGAWCLVALVPAAVAAATSSFTFQVPDGWVDISPGAPAQNFARLAPALQAQAQSGKFAFFAADLDGAGDGFIENVNVVIEPHVEPITRDLLASYAREMGQQIAKAMPGATATVMGKGLVKIGAVTCGRVVQVIDMGAGSTKQIQYLVPGKSEMAIITYSSSPEAFDRYEAIFDAAALATLGAAEPPRRWIEGIRSSAIIGGIAGGLGALIWALLRRRGTS